MGDRISLSTAAGAGAGTGAAAGPAGAGIGMAVGNGIGTAPDNVRVTTTPVPNRPFCPYRSTAVPSAGWRCRSSARCRMVLKIDSCSNSA